MADNARGVHVSPGIYSREVELTYAVKSLGITTLGVAGETLRGPAFQPMRIENWREFVDVFGGTSTEKYKGSQYPKYELPYIAKSYLSESKQLEVVRVLGLSGYKAGPAWVITASMGNDGPHYAVAVLRSRGHYEYFYKFNQDTAVDDCACSNTQYDKLVYEVGEIRKDRNTCSVTKYNDILKLGVYKSLVSTSDCNETSLGEGEGNLTLNNGFTVSGIDNGRFTISGLKGIQNENEEVGENKNGYFEYAVSLNPTDKDFILKVLGTDPKEGEAPIYVESLYEEALHWMIEDGKIDQIDVKLSFYNAFNISDYSGLSPVSGLLTKQESALVRSDLGRRFLITEDNVDADAPIYVHPYAYKTNLPLKSKDKDKVEGFVVDDNTVASDKDNPVIKQQIDKDLIGQIVTVKAYTDISGKRHYFYAYYPQSEIKKENLASGDKIRLIDKLIATVYEDTVKGEEDKSPKLVLVKNNSDGFFYRMVNADSTLGLEVRPITCDLHNYSDSYRFASTPWIVSNLKGDANNIEVNRLFRFHTISDGTTSNYEVKVSIENILPDDGLFDVVVRDINDTDEFVKPLEKFAKVSLIPGSKDYIAYKIGSFDGIYESKSKYITVEVNETDATKTSVPAGFLGYPKPNYSGQMIGSENKNEDVEFPIIKYNQYYDSSVKNRKQYFGLSSKKGIDIDLFTYKGMAAYIDAPEYMTKGFHLDARLDTTSTSNESGRKVKITVDGEAYDDMFECVSANNYTELLSGLPVIGTEEQMYGSIYQYRDLRKFTVYFYGGFDGWDVYRDQRSNTDEFKVSNYRGIYDKFSGEGQSVNKIWDPEAYNLNQDGITSDWYAYLSAYRLFANPEAVDINVFATPGIDYVNNKTLVEEVIDMIETERADSIYVVTTPDKPSGANDYVDEMYRPDDAVANLEFSDLDSNYTCTYYPWVKYLDQDNNQYIYLPATKDAVRNMALSDNQYYSWFAPAGEKRGVVDCVRAKIVTKIGEEDTLYEGRINPIKTFAQDGEVLLWGQKTLQNHESQLNRIAVRRLLLRMRKMIAVACRSLIFEPNDPTTKSQFLSAVTPIMDNIRANRGISDYRIEVNDTIESRERRELPAKIYFKAYNALEYVVLDFILTPEGLSFTDI